jgi:seryl-tRNA synthetase
LSDFRCDLVDGGLLMATGVDGVVGRSAVFEDVLARLNAAILHWGRQYGAETVHFPPVMNRAHLERNGYLKSFPQLAAALHGFTCNDHGHATGEDLATDLVMVPAACYPIYPMVAARGPLPPGGASFNIQSWCFRREPSKDAPRLQSFRMHEYVRLGTPDDVLSFREDWIAAAR